MPHKNLVALLCEPHKQEQLKWVFLLDVNNVKLNP